VIHLDTSFLIRALAGDSAHDRHLRDWIGLGEPMGMSAIGWAEFLCGPVGLTEIALARRILGEPVTFVGDDATLAARLFNDGGRRRGSLVDCMIAAVALRADARLATANPSDFRRYEGAGLRLMV
jgi:predicted nucleic acid-binding protein